MKRKKYMKKQIRHQHALNTSSYATRCTARIAQPLLIALFLLIFTNTTAAQERTLFFPITSKQFSQYYIADYDVFEFTIKPEYEKHKLTFTPQEMTLSIKGDGTCVGELIIGQEYIELGRFLLDEYLYKLIMYNGFCDGWIPALNVQLNSYDKTGNPTDALLLENRFAYEDIERFTNFTIDRDTISIDYYITYVIAMNELGDLGEPIENPVPELFDQRQYKIDNGHFSLIDKTDHIKDGSK